MAAAQTAALAAATKKASNGSGSGGQQDESPLLVYVQPYVESELGNAHQKWRIDGIGFVYAFASTDHRDIEVMAANKASICTYYVSRDKELSQTVCLFVFCFLSL